MSAHAGQKTTVTVTSHFFPESPVPEWSEEDWASKAHVSRDTSPKVWDASADGAKNRIDFMLEEQEQTGRLMEDLTLRGRAAATTNSTRHLDDLQRTDEYVCRMMEGRLTDEQEERLAMFILTSRFHS